MEDLEKFTIKFIYNDKHSKRLAEARALKWKIMKKKSTQRLPPDPDSFNLRAQRVNYQSYIFTNYMVKDAPPSPISYGWTIIEGVYNITDT